MRVRPDEVFNISMNLLDGSLQESGIWGLRVDYWDEYTSSYPPESSLFFYDIKEPLTVRPSSKSFLHLLLLNLCKPLLYLHAQVCRSVFYNSTCFSSFSQSCIPSINQEFGILYLLITVLVYIEV